MSTGHSNNKPSTNNTAAKSHKGRHVECAHANNADRRVIGRKQKRAASLVKKRGFRLYASRVHQRQSLVENPSLGDCKDDWFSHNGRALGRAGGKGNIAVPMVQCDYSISARVSYTLQD